MGKKILIIDDDDDLSREMADILRDEGHTVDTRLYKPEELPEFKPHKYEIIILDFKMPGITGADILRTIPENHAGTKILLISGRPFVEKILKETGQFGKVVEIISKPFSIQNLLKKIAAL
ncbi:MAG: response regulator [Candidatus Omnitrophica bacterium]|nr:response regulator [Candidatus Omnitrophota bacterium]